MHKPLKFFRNDAAAVITTKEVPARQFSKRKAAVYSLLYKSATQRKPDQGSIAGNIKNVLCFEILNNTVNNSMEFYKKISGFIQPVLQWNVV